MSTKQCKCNKSLIWFRALGDKAEEPVDESLRGSMVRLKSPPNTRVPSANEARADRHVSSTESGSTFGRYRLARVNVCE